MARWSNRRSDGGWGCIWAAIAIFLIGFAAWVTHVVVCIQDGKWALLFIGAFAFPVAIIHGFGIWLGFWH